MWKYLNAAIFARTKLGALGHVPVNLLAAVAFGVLGIVFPAAWLVGAGVMTLVIFTLANTRRFREVVDGLELAEGSGRSAMRKQELVASLDADSRQRLAALQVRGARVMETYRASGADSVIEQSSRDALDRLEWLFLKLLIARRSMRDEAAASTERQLSDEIAQIDRELQLDRFSPSVRESRTATRELLSKRLENIAHRRQSIQEIESDMQRIEAQVDLAYDDATLRGKPVAIATNIQLASQMLDTSLYGSSLHDLDDLDTPSSTPRLPDTKLAVERPERDS